MTQPPNETRSASLFTHSTRKEWGVGILTWEDGGKRGYLFEDGEERTMASGFHQLMLRVEQPSADQQAAYDRLRRVIVAHESAANARKAGGPDFLTQFARFTEGYPAGLVDPKWVAEMRGAGAENRAPRHRDVAVREAQEVLSNTAVDALLASHGAGQLWEQIITLLASTDLVPAAQLKKPRSVDSEQQKLLAVAARELLYGKAPYEQRFDKYVGALTTATKEPIRWEMATALSALVHPTQHVCVFPTPFRHQLKALGSRGTVAARPTSAGYTRLLSITRLVGNKLTEQGQVPRDLLDVHDFIRFTLGPAVKPRVARASVRPSAAPAPLDEGSEEGAEDALDDAADD